MNSNTGKGTGRAPVSIATTARQSRPDMRRTERSERIKHRELIASVNGSTAFTALKYAVNPGLAQSFPWLSQIAARWEQYRFHALKFHYLTRTSTATVGSVILAPDYDAQDTAPNSEAQITAYQDAVEDASWKDIVCTLRPDSMFPLGPRKFIRSGNVAGDIKTYDAANFFLATVEMASAAAVGKLWVEYDVEFYIPNIGATPGSESDTVSSYLHTASQAVTTGVPFTIDFEDQKFDPLGIGLPVAGVFTPPAGCYRVSAVQSFQDDTAETLSIVMAFFVNGAIPSTSCQSTVTMAVPANGGFQVSQECLLACNGTDTVEVIVIANAGGVVTALPNGGGVMFSMA